MHAKSQYKVLSNSYNKDQLLEMGKRNNVDWDEHKHEGVNWMRFSGGLTRHIREGKDLHHDDTHPDVLNKMHSMYTQLRDMHKQSMVPHVRGAMYKLHSEQGVSDKRPVDFVKDAYRHLDANGGHAWAEKVSTLHHLNEHVRKLSERLGYN